MIDWISTNSLGLMAQCERWLGVLQEDGNIGKYHFDRVECEAAAVKIKAFTAAWARFEMVDSSANRVLKNEAAKEARAAMRRFAASSVRFNDRIDRGVKESMGVMLPKTARTARTRPTSQPYTVAELTGNRFEHRLKALRHEGRRGSKPADACGVRFAWQVGGVKPASGEDLPKTRFGRRAVQVIAFTEADAGKTAWYASCYENAKGEAGAWSPIVEMYIG